MKELNLDVTKGNLKFDCNIAFTCYSYGLCNGKLLNIIEKSKIFNSLLFLLLIFSVSQFIRPTRFKMFMKLSWISYSIVIIEFWIFKNCVNLLLIFVHHFSIPEDATRQFFSYLLHYIYHWFINQYSRTCNVLFSSLNTLQESEHF